MSERVLVEELSRMGVHCICKWSHILRLIRIISFFFNQASVYILKSSKLLESYCAVIIFVHIKKIYFCFEKIFLLKKYYYEEYKY